MTSRSSLSLSHDWRKSYPYVALIATGHLILLLTVNRLKQFGGLNTSNYAVL